MGICGLLWHVWPGRGGNDTRQPSGVLPSIYFFLNFKMSLISPFAPQGTLVPVVAGVPVWKEKVCERGDIGHQQTLNVVSCKLSTDQKSFFWNLFFIFFFFLSLFFLYRDII